MKTEFIASEITLPEDGLIEAGDTVCLEGDNRVDLGSSSHHIGRTVRALMKEISTVISVVREISTEVEVKPTATTEIPQLGTMQDAIVRPHKAIDGAVVIETGKRAFRFDDAQVEPLIAAIREAHYV